MIHKWLLGACACALALTPVTGAFAQNEGGDLEIVAVEGTAADTADTEAEMMEEEVVAAEVTVVWWGNRSISYGNYLKFEKVGTDCPGICERCDTNSICCDTGCLCESCQYICDDCDNCPPTFDKIFFDLDKSFLRPDAILEANKILHFLELNPDVSVMIEGHCCDLASDSYNIGLGDRRAHSVERYLEEHGVSPGRIQTQTFGERRPWVGVEQRQLNRRAIVIALPKGTR